MSAVPNDWTKAGYINVSEMGSALFGEPVRNGVVLTKTFITETLGVPPCAQTGLAYYWAPEQVRKIRRSMISCLAVEEVLADKLLSEQGEG